MKKKYFLITLAVIVVLLILLNPTLTEFRSYVEFKTRFSAQEHESLICVRKNYYLIFSVYEYRHEGMFDTGKKDPEFLHDYGKYIGILKNFFKIDGTRFVN